MWKTQILVSFLPGDGSSDALENFKPSPSLGEEWLRFLQYDESLWWMWQMHEWRYSQDGKKYQHQHKSIYKEVHKHQPHLLPYKISWDAIKGPNFSDLMSWPFGSETKHQTVQQTTSIRLNFNTLHTLNKHTETKYWLVWTYWDAGCECRGVKSEAARRRGE